MDAYDEDGAFYTVTCATTAKMRQIAQKPEVAVCIIVESFGAFLIIFRQAVRQKHVDLSDFIEYKKIMFF